MKVIIVDDEKLARNGLRSLLEKYENIEVVGEAGDIKTAKKLLKELSPDVVFLDVQLQGETGFDLTESIPRETSIIFVTAYDEYAIRAFEVNAMDYLTKPIYPKRLDMAIDRLAQKQKNDNAENNNEELKVDDHLFLTMNHKSSFVKVSSIQLISAAGDYTEIITAEGKKGLSSTSMKEWEKRLPERLFYRIHRSSIINIECVDYLEDWFNNSYKVYLKNNKDPLIMSRRYANKIKDRLKK